MESCDLVWPISQLESSPRAPRDYFLQQWKSLCITVPVWSASINKPAEYDRRWAEVSVKASFNKSIEDERRTLNMETNNLRNRRERESQICVQQTCRSVCGESGSNSIESFKTRAEIIQRNTRRWPWTEARSNPKIRSLHRPVICLKNCSLYSFFIPEYHSYRQQQENDPADGCVNAFLLSPQWLPNSLHPPHRVCS